LCFFLFNLLLFISLQTKQNDSCLDVFIYIYIYMYINKQRL